MPNIEGHVETSRQRTGKDYLELHEWIDRGEQNLERRDIVRIEEIQGLMSDKG